MGHQDTDRIVVIAGLLLLAFGVFVAFTTFHPWFSGTGVRREDTSYHQVDPGRVRITIRDTKLTVTNVGAVLVSCGGEHEVGVAYPTYDLRAGNAMVFDTRTVQMITCTAGHGLDVVYRAERGSAHQEYVRDL